MSEGEIKFNCPVCNFKASEVRHVDYVTIPPDHIWAVKTDTHVVVKKDEWEKIIKVWKEAKKREKTQ